MKSLKLSLLITVTVDWYALTKLSGIFVFALGFHLNSEVVIFPMAWS
jgi:hypothetical protein